MQLRDDRRGQAIQIGAVLLLGAVVLTFSVYQATVVPQQNSEIEFKHSQTVQDQLSDVRNAIVSTGQIGDGRSVSVTLGTNYPSRTIALNPPPPVGSLGTVGSTNESVNVTVANAEASGETGDFWTGANRSYNTGALVYRPGYNEYQGAPVTWYENSVLFNQFRSANLTVSDQRLLDGDRISLVTLNGSYYASQSESVSLDLRGVSTSSRTVSVTNATADSNVTITLPTRLTRSDWLELLDGEDHVANVTTTAIPDAEYDLVHVVLERDVTYELQVTRVGIGTEVVRPEPRYLTSRSGSTPTVPEGGQVDFTVEVRDALDNPNSDVRVIAGTRWDNSSVSPTNTTSDGDGTVTLTYQSPPNISNAPQRTDYVQVSLNTSLSSAVNSSTFNGSTAVNVTLPVRVDNSDGSGLAGDSEAFDVYWTDPTQSGVTCQQANDPDSVCTVNASETTSVTLTSDTGPTADRAQIEYAVNNRTVGSVTPSSDTTDGNGQASTVFTPKANGTVTVYASGGGSGDRLELVVENVTTGGGGFEFVRATSMPAYGVSQEQNVTLVPSSDIPASESVYVNLSDPQQTGPTQVDYNGPNAVLVRDGGGAATIGNTNTWNNEDNAIVRVDFSANLTAGTPIELRLTGIGVGKPGVQTDPYDVVINRTDAASTNASFVVAPDAGTSRLSSVSATNLTADSSGQAQTVSFTPQTRLPAGEVVVVELSDPQSAVDYSNAGRSFASGSDVTTGSLSFEQQTVTNTTLVYTAPSGGVSAGDTVAIDLTSVSTASGSTGSYTVAFSRGDADVRGATYDVVTPPGFAVTIDSTNSPVTEGETVQVDATIDNTGNAGDTQTIELYYDDTGDGTANTLADSQQVTLAPGASQSTTLQWTTATGDAGDVAVRVASADNADTSTVTVQQTLQPDAVQRSNTVLEFTFDNTGSQQVTIEQFAVDATAITPGNTINNGNSLEVEIRGGQQDGEAGRNSNPKDFLADGTRYDLQTDSNGNTAGQYAVLNSGDRPTVDMRAFAQRLDNGGTNPLQFTNSAADADVVVTFVLSDGTEQVFYLEQQ
ncbi:beta strand repeat-containing protein [Halapricum salinum]|uniref:CARDB domain-containing protein n=1 Tax=Halapricum salinum TaxID=1457250 RepID=A0A4D6HBR0_9EURY|nr:CARDB domain-containing protein [Halapricum salinum]QCC51240.1 hypothetical protein DV733_08275 [Halapricum salinum]